MMKILTTSCEIISLISLILYKLNEIHKKTEEFIASPKNNASDKTNYCESLILNTYTMSKKKEYTIKFLDVDYKTEKEEKMNRLLKARAFAIGLNRESRFIGLTNSKGISIPLK